MYICEIHFARYADYLYPPWQPALKNLNKPFLQHSGQLKPGDVIYCCTHMIPQVADILKDATVPFIIISGLSDNFIPWQSDTDQFPKNFESDKLLENKNLLAWFGLNKMENHPLLHHIPIGIPRCKVFFGETERTAPSPYMGFYCDLFGHEAMHAYLENFRPEDILRRMQEKPVRKDNLLYCRYTTHNSEITLLRRNYQFRHKLDKHLEKIGIKKPELCNWEEHIKDVQNYRFVVCPPGRCLDGFLLWESLIVGTIPITFTSEINDLYKDLPIVILDKIEDLTQEFLEEKHKEIISRKDYNFKKLDMEYWIKQIDFYKNKVVPKEVKILGLITESNILISENKLFDSLQNLKIDKKFILTKFPSIPSVFLAKSEYDKIFLE